MSDAGTVCLITANPQPGLEARYALTGEQTTVGRHPSNDVVLAVDSISRFHARIDRRGEIFILQDLNSANGSFVNGERASQVTLHHGDKVTFGNVEMEFMNRAHQAAAPAAMAQAGGGRAIVDIEDDSDAGRPTTQSFIRAEDVASKGKSSVISSAVGATANRAELIKLNQRVTALYELSEVIRELEDEQEEEVLKQVLDVVFKAVSADRGVVLTRSKHNPDELEVTAVKYLDQPIVEQKVRVSRTILDQVVREKVSVLSKDAQADERFNSSESIIATKIRSAICAPMLLQGGVLGVLFIDTMRSDRPFDQEDLEFVTIVANETGLALANARMRAEAEHRQRLAAVGETVAGISHNVKNMLLLSQGGAELLTRALDKQDMNGARDAWGVVSRGIDKIGKLVRDMLEFSSSKDPELTMVNINDLIEEIAEQVEDKLISKGVSLELDLDDNISERLLDETGLSRCVENLVVNALEAITHSEGEIVVVTGLTPSDDLEIVVKDNGTGIPPHVVQKIFYPFFTTKGSQGTGLGLSMCKKSIEDMKGTMDVESEEGVGTTFIIRIPVLREAAVTREE